MISLSKLYKRDKGICHICEQRVLHMEDASRDHVTPKIYGGTSGYNSNNIKLAHKWCNEQKGRKLFRVEQHKTGWVIIDPNGEISDEIYTNQYDALSLANSLNKDKIYLDGRYK